MNFAAIFLVAALDAAILAPGGRFQLERSRDSFGMRVHGIIETLAAGQTKFYPLPQSTPAQYRRLRPEDVRINPFSRDRYDRQETIGSYQVEGTRIWFGNNYYDGEGDKGVGAFGYFETATRAYTLFSPPEVAPWEISAILVGAENIWVALDRFGEDISRTPGGLVRWNRRTRETQRFSLEFVVTSIRADGNGLRLETHDGWARFEEGRLQRFLRNGKPTQRFPPPRTHY